MNPNLGETSRPSGIMHNYPSQAAGHTSIQGKFLGELVIGGLAISNLSSEVQVDHKLLTFAAHKSFSKKLTVKDICSH